jgi:hypothetical protein
MLDFGGKVPLHRKQKSTGPDVYISVYVQTLGNTPVKIACPKGASIARVPGGTWAGLECQAPYSASTVLNRFVLG